MARTHVRRRLAAASAALAIAIGVGFLGGRASAHASHAGPARVVVVQRGDTVWAIARRVVGPSGDPRPLVRSIVLRNHLDDGAITVGERLFVPLG